MIAKTKKPEITLKYLRDKLRKLHYEISEELYDKYSYYAEERFRVYSRGGGTDYNSKVIEFEISELPHCCGVVEIGDLSIKNAVGTADISEVIELAIAYCFLHTKLENTKKSTINQEIVSCKVVMFCSNGVGTSAIFEKAWRKYLSTHFKVVSTTKNKSTGRIIKIFVATY